MFVVIYARRRLQLDVCTYEARSSCEYVRCAVFPITHSCDCVQPVTVLITLLIRVKLL